MRKKFARVERAIIVNPEVHGKRAVRGMLYGFVFSGVFWLAIGAAVWLF